MEKNVHLLAVLVVLLVAAMILGVVFASGCGERVQVVPGGNGPVANPNPAPGGHGGWPPPGVANPGDPGNVGRPPVGPLLPGVRPRRPDVAALPQPPRRPPIWLPPGNPGQPPMFEIPAQSQPPQPNQVQPGGRGLDLGQRQPGAVLVAPRHPDVMFIPKPKRIRILGR